MEVSQTTLKKLQTLKKIITPTQQTLKKKYFILKYVDIVDIKAL